MLLFRALSFRQSVSPARISTRLFSDKQDYTRPVIQWYPGHIAKAERQLQETLQAVDVILEVRDARIPKATAHPLVGTWCAGKPRLVVLTHVDAVPGGTPKAWGKAYETFGHPEVMVDKNVQNQAQQAMAERFKYTTTDPKTTTTNNLAPVESVLWVDAKQGSGLFALKRAVLKAGHYVQERRDRRGLKARPLRVGLLGFPNVGKSALLNQILGRKRAKTANTPGVTRSLQWIRVRSEDTSEGGSAKSQAKDFELLDSPGIIPAALMDQSDALLLAACNCIGQAAYDNQAVAAYLCEWMLALYRLGYGPQAAPQWQRICRKRYKFDPLDDKVLSDGTQRPRTGEDMLFDVADATCLGNPEDAARKLLQDFRVGRWGPVCLQLAPDSDRDDGQKAILMEESRDDERQRWEEQQQERARVALETAKELGLELPPMVEQQPTSTTTVAEQDVGKGLFDGW